MPTIAENQNTKLPLQLSVVVIAYNISRELPRTLYTLSEKFQREIHSDDYEIIVVDNGSKPAVDLSDDAYKLLPHPLPRVIHVQNPSASPAAALNLGIAAAQGQYIGVMIDGARMCSPGLLSQALAALHARPDAVVCTLGWYLGYDYQRLAIKYGYDQAQEDALLDTVDWAEDGYQLFDISAMDESTVDGWHQGFSESNAIFMHQSSWQALGGFDLSFDLPGGGLVNLDLCRRSLEDLQMQCILLLGEATFHQVHGGAATNISAQQLHIQWQRWSEQYMQIRGQPWVDPVPHHPILYWGRVPDNIKTIFLRSILGSSKAYPSGTPSPALIDCAMPDHVWCATPLSAAQMHLYHAFQHALQAGLYGWLAKSCRLLRKHYPQWYAPQHLLRLVAPWSLQDDGLNQAETTLLNTMQTWLESNCAEPFPCLISQELLSPAEKEKNLNLALGKANEQLVQKAAQIDGLLESRSWRITAPLRRLLDHGKGVKKP